MPKVLVHRTTSSVSFHDVHCSKDHRHIVRVPEEKALFQHYTNMYMKRTRPSRVKLFKRLPNLYTSKWMAKVHAEVVRRFPGRATESESELPWDGEIPSDFTGFAEDDEEEKGED
jgi:hypothetical protein